jgi:hypothetical protein
VHVPSQESKFDTPNIYIHMIVQTPLAWYRHLNNKMSRLTSFMGRKPPFLVKTFDLYYVKLKVIVINYLLHVKFNERKNNTPEILVLGTSY